MGERAVNVPGHGGSGSPEVFYKVRWKGAGEGEEEWFPRADLLADFP